MLITNDKKIREIQYEFNQKFPNLKIEFYSQSHQAGEGSSNKNKLDSELSIEDARTINKEGDLTIHGNEKVSTLEASFKELYGLNVQVFRRSTHNVWLQTIATDNWTLAEQNKRGQVTT